VRTGRLHALTKDGQNSPAHERENHAALDVHLTKQDLAQLDRAFPAPTGPDPLEML